MILTDKPMVVLEVANNHQGDIDHGHKIINEFGQVCRDFSEIFDFAIKFQYRHLETFVHPDYRDKEIKYVRRFLDTQLTESEWQSLIKVSRENQFKTMCTPFDEKSVSKVVKDNFDFLKIASASLDDWPLIEEVAKAEMKIIASVGGADLETIKRFYKNTLL
jgi:sialic acid synthase SpsE